MRYSALASIRDLVRRDPREALSRAVLVPRLYMAAFRGRTRLRSSLSEDMSIDAILDVTRSFRWGRESIAATQIRSEITRLLEILAADPPRTVLEIGTLNGGTLLMWCRVSTPDALLVTLDLHGSSLRRWSPQHLIFQSFARPQQRVIPLSRIDSHAPTTVETVKALFQQQAVDFLFIDGGHGYDDVKQDFELYSPLVRPGGLVAFHDVSPNPTPETVGVLEFWNELKQTHSVEEIIESGSHLGYGIGLVRIPS